jgi:FtsZ-binding cell division protein ZapB
LKKAKEELVVAITENKKLLDLQKALQIEVDELKKKIKELESGGTVPDADAEQLKQQLTSLQSQLVSLQEFISGLWNSQEIRLEKLSVLSKLRGASDDKALDSQQMVIKEVEQNPDWQPQLIQLLSLMHPQFDDLNWLSLGFIFNNKLQDKAIQILIKNRSSGYLESMLILVKELEFPDELGEAWQKMAEKSRILRFSPTAINQIKVLKITQLLPASLDIADEHRAAIKNAVSADSGLLKPLSQLKAVVGENYQPLLWATLPGIIESEKLPEFLEFVLKLVEKNLPLGLGVASTNNRFKISVALRNEWAEIDLQL